MRPQWGLPAQVDLERRQRRELPRSSGAHPGVVAFRDAKAPARRPVVVRSDRWTSFIKALKRPS
ncbi:DUF397 domain-containing protein [Streptomyces sp. WMMC897]|nr:MULTISPECIES: DUF397 domain-containing protein [unclassified Streptomyces]MCZ7415234.1 DUF397 domain-containing protein [Streptomyces sp. WMMC897]MCZ7432177.1 DUF397 domain-containing protein [Streptomyces sp. WMMC1477]